ncbi:hypothetical protein Emed_001330 [Eimeria media]
MEKGGVVEQEQQQEDAFNYSITSDSSDYLVYQAAAPISPSDNEADTPKATGNASKRRPLLGILAAGLSAILLVMVLGKQLHSAEVGRRNRSCIVHLGGSRLRKPLPLEPPELPTADIKKTPAKELEFDSTKPLETPEELLKRTLKSREDSALGPLLTKLLIRRYRTKLKEKYNFQDAHPDVSVAFGGEGAGGLLESLLGEIEKTPAPEKTLSVKELSGRHFSRDWQRDGVHYQLVAWFTIAGAFEVAFWDLIEQSSFLEEEVRGGQSMLLPSAYFGDPENGEGTVTLTSETLLAVAVAITLPCSS